MAVDFIKRLQAVGSAVYTQRVSDTAEQQNASSLPELPLGPSSADDPFLTGRCRVGSRVFLGWQVRAAARGCSPERDSCLARNGHCVGRDLAFRIRSLAGYLPGSVRRQFD